MSDKDPGENLGRCSGPNSMSSDKTIGYEDEKTDGGTFVCFFMVMLMGLLYMLKLQYTYVHLMFDVRFLELEWKALPNTTEKKFDDPEQIPIPDFSAIVDRCLQENKSQEVWDMVSMLTDT